MKKRLVIFGDGNIGQLAHFYFTADTGYEVAAFTVDAAYLTQASFCGLPVVAFEEVTQRFSPDEHELFVALSYSKLNALRKKKYLAAKSWGYRLASYVSPRATVLNEGRIGENCFILEGNTIQPFAIIGNNVTQWSGSHIGHHSIIGDHCFIAPDAAVAGGVKIGEQCFIGVNATLRNHIMVGARCVIGAGAVLLADAAPDGVYTGNPAKRAKKSSGTLKRI